MVWVSPSHGGCYCFSPIPNARNHAWFQATDHVLLHHSQQRELVCHSYESTLGLLYRWPSSCALCQGATTLWISWQISPRVQIWMILSFSCFIQKQEWLQHANMTRQHCKKRLHTRLTILIDRRTQTDSWQRMRHEIPRTLSLDQLIGWIQWLRQNSKLNLGYFRQTFPSWNAA
jgi:hypothetical protein